MKQNKKFAITGGIGSGKTVVCDILRKKGYAVFSCDDISRELWMEEDYRKGLVEIFPSCVVQGEIVKERLAALVFSDESELERLNAYAHPRIMRELMTQMEEYEVSFAEVPLLFEGGYENLFDGIIAVRRNDKARVSAVSARDGLSEAQIKLRMARQFDPELLDTKNCFILENNCSKETLECDLERILNTII